MRAWKDNNMLNSLKESKLTEKSLYSIKNDPIAYIIRDTTNGKYLLDNPSGITYSTEYSDDAWWGDTIDDASVFINPDDAFYTLEDVNADFHEESSGNADMDRFNVNAIYAEDIFVKTSPLNKNPYMESKNLTYNKFKEERYMYQGHETEEFYKKVTFT